MHSDIRGIDWTKISVPPSSSKFSHHLIESAFTQIEKIADGREIFLPTFNYDFTTTKKYNVKSDLSQVGKIPSASIQRLGWYRSDTPVYSFSSNKGKPNHFQRPFSENSVFNDLVQLDAEILMLGVGFESFTFLHHIEHLFNIPYRYEKSFAGEVIDGGKTLNVDVTFHVRPRGLNLEYDFEKIGDLLLNSRAALKVDSTRLVISARSSLEVVSRMLSIDPFILLKPDSSFSVQNRLSQLGRAFTLEDFE